LEAELAARGKLDLLELVQSMIPKHINCIYIASPKRWAWDTLCCALRRWSAMNRSP